MTGLGRQRWTLLVVMVVLGAATLAGCGLVDTLSGKGDDDADLADKISVDYSRIGVSGMIDQALTLHNSAGSPVVLDASVEALDGDGEVIRSVKTHGVYGATNGMQVLVPGDNVDFLVFTGPGASKVRDVRLEDIEVEKADFPLAVGLVEAVPLDGSGAKLDYPANFASVSLRNPNSAPVTVRVVSIVWNRPKVGESQQALKVVPLSGLVKVPAHGQKAIAVSASKEQLIAGYASTNALSLKAYFST